MKHLLLTTIAAVVLVGCGEKQHYLNDPIWLSAAKGDLNGIKQHLADGVDVNANGGGVMRHAALHNAILAEKILIVEFLIQNGADVNLQTKVGMTPMDLAVNNKKISDLLRKHGGKTGAELSIHKATSEGNIEAVKQHLAAGTDVNRKDDDGGTPLHNAAYGSHKEIAELLIANGADVNEKDNDGDTPL
ncbi:ankyrin repeat domain-containing protein, partial [bacterium]|nr:ankyrin repeat domain-containing protein [bacterium]